MSTIPDGSVDMILCDLPYGTTACKWDSVIPFDDLWRAYNRVAKKNAAMVFTASQPFTSALVMSNAKHFKHEWIWKKNYGSNFLNVKHAPMKEHESVLVFYRAKPCYNPQRQQRSEVGQAMVRANVKTNIMGGECYGGGFHGKDKSDYDLTTRCPSSVQSFNMQRGLHPTQKPVNLMEYMLRTYSNPGDVVLDNCMGSGTTGLACKNLDRNFIGIEQDAGYFAIAQNRLA